MIEWYGKSYYDFKGVDNLNSLVIEWWSSFIAANGYVYETFGISKHFSVKLQVLLIRAEMLDNPLTGKCFIYDVEQNLKVTEASA